ncbi:MAG: hypothetical protein WBB67_06705 [bacterium]
MAQELLNSFEEKGLSCPFIASKTGDLVVASSAESIKNEIAQMTTVIFETIGAVGDIDIDKIEILADSKCLVLALDQENLMGSLFEQSEDVRIDDIWSFLQELKEQSAGIAVAEKEKPKEKPEEKPREKPEEKPREKPGEKPKEKPEEKPGVIIDASILDNMKDAMKDYLGDFTERIFKNQLKAQRIKVEELYDTDARRLVFALGKAAGMIIGPSKGRDMTNKLLELLK